MVAYFKTPYDQRSREKYKRLQSERPVLRPRHSHFNYYFLSILLTSLSEFASRSAVSLVRIPIFALPNYQSLYRHQVKLIAAKSYCSV